MTRLATMGTSSCATIAIAGFKDTHYKMELQYQDCPDEYVLPEDGYTVSEFQTKVITPLAQPLGHSKEYPFSLLMKKMDAQRTLAAKFILLTLNSYQMEAHDNFWPKLVESHGFVKMDTTKNNQGALCTIYVRNNSRPA